MWATDGQSRPIRRSTSLYVAAPPVIEFDQDGNVVQAWGGDGPDFKWGSDGHGIHVDHNNFVWVADNVAATGGHIYKFTRDGKFLLQIGKPSGNTGNADTKSFRQPADASYYAKNNEVFFADGYGNHRVIVYDADTGAYKRHWGAYGKPPDDSAPRTRIYERPGPTQFNTVHGIRISSDDLVYVGDRVNNRIQVFEKSGKFVRQFVIEPKTLINGTVHDMILSPDPMQTYLFVGNGSDGEIYIVRRDTGERVASFGRMGRMAGEFYGLHNLAVDSRGNLFTGEVRTGKRIQRFVAKN